MALQQYGRAIIIAARKEVGNARSGQYRRIGPRIRRHIGDVGVVERRTVFAAEICTWIQGPNQSLRSGKTGKQIGRLRRKIDMLLSDRRQNALPLLRRTRAQELVQVPFAIGAETKVGVPVRQIHRFVKDAALNRRYLGLVIGVAHVEVHMRHHVEGPLLLRVERLAHLGGLSIQLYLDLRARSRGKLRHIELQALLAEVLLRCERLR